MFTATIQVKDALHSTFCSCFLVVVVIVVVVAAAISATAGNRILIVQPAA
jgi:hypothetical protein